VPTATLLEEALQVAARIAGYSEIAVKLSKEAVNPGVRDEVEPRREIRAPAAAWEFRRSGSGRGYAGIDPDETRAGLTATPLWQVPQRRSCTKTRIPRSYRPAAQIPRSIDARLASAAALGR
jgi:hypothetical protein